MAAPKARRGTDCLRRAAVVELVDEPTIVGVGVLPLLVRPRQVEVGFSGQQVQPAAKGFLIAAHKRMDVVARQIAKANQQPENLDVAFSRIDGDGLSVTADDGIG